MTKYTSKNGKKYSRTKSTMCVFGDLDVIHRIRYISKMLSAQEGTQVSQREVLRRAIDIAYPDSAVKYPREHYDISEGNKKSSKVTQ